MSFHDWHDGPDETPPPWWPRFVRFAPFILAALVIVTVAMALR